MRTFGGWSLQSTGLARYFGAPLRIAHGHNLGRLCFFRKGRYVGGFANVTEPTDPVAAARTLASKIP